MTLTIPAQPFFESAARSKTPMLIVGNKIFKTTTNKVDSTTSNFFHFNEQDFKLEPSQRALSDYDEDYLKMLNLDELVSQQLEKETKGLEEEIKSMIEALESNQILFFIENHVFKYIGKNKSKVSYKHTAKKQEDGERRIGGRSLEEKVSAKIRHKNLYILSNSLFKGDLYFILSKGVKHLVETDSPDPIYVAFSGKKYELRPYASLKALEKTSHELIRQQIDRDAEEAKKRLQELEKDKERYKKLTQKEFEEGNFRFIKENGSYIVFTVCPPHAYINGDDYYLFEETKVGIRIPVKNGKIGAISIDKCRPFVLDKKYSHPCLPTTDREICFTGKDPASAKIAIKKDIEKKIAKEKSKGEVRSTLDEKAYQLCYILNIVGINTMRSGYTKEANPFRSIEEYPRKTRTEYLRWAKKKIKQGLEVYETKI